jgi:E3 ubiquitin-protein ligase listerin
MAKPKMQARSSRIAVSSPSAFGFGANPANSEGERPPSTLSYFAELPNISAISNPSVVVFFRNLFKRDSTTKARALEDLQAYLDENPHVEDAVLEAWVGLASYRRDMLTGSRLAFIRERR